MPKYIDRVAMFSTHGYFQSQPQLGKVDTGGQVTYVLELAKGLMRIGVDVDIFTRQFEDYKQVEIVRREAGHTTRIIRIPAGGDAFIPKERFFPIIDDLAEGAIKWIDEQGITYNFFHGHYWDGGILAAKLAKHYNSYHIWTPHSLGSWKRSRLLKGGMSEAEVEERFNLNSRVKVEEEIIASAKKVISLSNIQSRDYKKYTKFPGGKLITITAGVNVRQFNKNKNAYDYITIFPENMVFSVSRFSAAKRLDLLIHAFAYVVERRPNAFLLIGGGSENPEEEEVAERRMLRKLITKLRLRNNVLFAGYIPHETFLPAYYRGSAVFVMYSSFEPFGLTVLEAMACGTPTVVSKHAGAADIMTSAQELTIIDPKNSKEFGKAIIQLLDDEELRKEKSEKSLKLIEEKFSWEKVALQHLALYKKY